MSLESIKPPRRLADVPRDKPQVDRIEHANLERRPGALLHPEARSRGRTVDTGWSRYAAGPRWH